MFYFKNDDICFRRIYRLRNRKRPGFGGQKPFGFAFARLQNEIIVAAEGALSYVLNVDGQPILGDSKLAMQFREGVTLGQKVELIKAERSSTDSTW